MELDKVEIFKTNVRQKRQAKKLLGVLTKKFPLFRINFDLDDCDKILRVEGKNIPQEKVAGVLAESGYMCIMLD